MKRLYQTVTGWWTAFALAISLAMLAAAHGFERFMGLAPCNLCLKQREVFWAAVVISGLATFWAVISRSRRGTPRIASFLLAAVFITGAITAGFHAGGEQGWWALPASCAAGNPLDFDLQSLSAFADGTASMGPIISCGDIAWSWLGLSMAAWNFILSVALAIVSLLAAKRPKDARAPKP